MLTLASMSSPVRPAQTLNHPHSALSRPMSHVKSSGPSLGVNDGLHDVDEECPLSHVDKLKMFVYLKNVFGWSAFNVVGELFSLLCVCLCTFYGCMFLLG